MVNKGWLALELIFYFAILGSAVPDDNHNTVIDAQVRKVFSIEVSPTGFSGWQIDPDKDGSNGNPYNQYSTGCQFTVKNNGNTNPWSVKAVTNRASARMNDGTNTLSHSLRVGVGASPTTYTTLSGPLTATPASIYQGSLIHGKDTQPLTYQVAGDYADTPTTGTMPSYAITVTYTLIAGT